MKTILSDGVSCRFKNMGVVCAILVVAIHVRWPHDAISIMWLIQHVVKHGIATVAVPFFFVASGFFLTRHMQEPDWYGTEIKKRIYSLAVPFVVWTIIFIILVAPLSVIADVVALRPFGSTPEFSQGRWVKTIGLDLRDGPRYLTALWYVRCLFCFVVFAPLFKWLVLKGRCVWLALCFTLVLCHESYPPASLQRFFQYGFSLSGVFYFSAGIYIGLSKGMKLSRSVFCFCVLVGAGLLVAKTLLAYFKIDSHFCLTALSIPFMMYSVWYVIPDTKWPRWLTSCSFPIFLMHQLLLAYAALLVKYSPFCSVRRFGCFFDFCFAVIASIGISTALRKFFPRLNNFLFAGRG